VNLSVTDVDVVSKCFLSGDHLRPSYRQSRLDLASPLFQVRSCKPQKPRSSSQSRLAVRFLKRDCELVSITREKRHSVNLSVIDVVSKSLLSGDHLCLSYHQSCLDLASPLFQVGSCKPQKPRSQKPRSPEPRSPKAMHHLKRLLIHPESDS